MKYALPILAILVALGSMFYANSRIAEVNANFKKQLSQLNSHDASSHEEEHIEVAEYMRALQWNMNKLYFAGINENQELADFYVHEIEEVIEEVANAGVMDDGVPVSKHMKTYGVTGIETFEKESKAEFLPAYANFMNSCNACHLVTNHGFIQIKAPETPISDNQVF